MKYRVEIPQDEAPRGKRGRRERNDEQRQEQKPKDTFKERPGFHNGARVTRR